MKKLFYFLVFIIAFSLISSCFINVKGDDRILSEMTEDECLEFIIDSGVTIPQSYSNSPVLKQFVKNTIICVENNLDTHFAYNYIDTLELAEAIKDVVNEYYGSIVLNALNRDPIQIDALENMANGQATKIIVPTDLQGIASLGVTLSELAKTDKKSKENNK